MTLSFNIEYRTSWGEEIKVVGSIPALGNNQPEHAAALHTVDGIHWTQDIEMGIPKNGIVQYNYQVWRNGKCVRMEWNGVPRTLRLGGNMQQVFMLQDCWRDLPQELPFYSSAFTESLLAHPRRQNPPVLHRRGVLIKAYAPTIDADHCLAICGNQRALGDWNPDKTVLMSDAYFPEWQVELDADKLCFPLEYKFVLYNKHEKRFEAWEENPNRYITEPTWKEHETLVIGDRYVHFTLPAWKGAGVAVPLFSLRSKGSWGVGDLGDLKRMIDWAVTTHQKVVQLLPISDTTMTHTWTDSYPYNSISIYAFHPMYTDVRQLGKLHNAAAMVEFNRRQHELNELPTVDYEKVNQIKWEYFRLIFQQEGKKVLGSDKFRKFFAENREWLVPYAAFCYLRDKFHTANFREWPQHSVYQSEDIEKLCRPTSPIYSEIAIYYYIQFNLHLQLRAAVQYAHAHGVILKGDIPIGISRNSVEAWKEPHYFNLNGQAGAPPDDFSANGQNWGFPTYNWEVMKQDGYAWWMKRFRKMAEYFDAYRIDHILGFFRIWEIPTHAVHGLLGQFVPALPLSRDEIAEYRLSFREEWLHPYIRDYVLHELFGPHTEWVKQTCLKQTDSPGIYQLREEFDTQRKVETYFAGQEDADSVWIREGLYALLSEVLFVPDRQRTDLYHPRIGVQHTYVYRSLSEWEQQAFNRLYDDYFYHRHNEFWKQQAFEKLPQLTQSTRMLVCGEDLGMIPDCVASVMHTLRILSLEIQRMPKDPTQEFGCPAQYPYHSICSFSTHDMSTLRGWWEEDAGQTQRFYNTVLGHYGTAPASASPELCEEVIHQQLAGNSLLCILSLQDWLSIDGALRHPNVNAERINVPANPRHYWRYRMHLSLEELIHAQRLNDKIKSLIANTWREG